MAIIDSSEETTMADGEGTDGADKPPHSGNATIHGISKQLNASLHITQQTTAAVPLPPPEASAYDKQPGHTRGDLKKLSLTPISPAVHKTPSSTTGSSEDDYGQSPSSSLPSSRAPSRPGSRAPSMSGGTSGGKLGASTVHPNCLNGKTVTPQRRPSESDSTNPFFASTVMPNQARPGKPASVHSDSGGSKFTLKDLLASGPKVTRKASQRSNASSRVSDSDAGSTDGGRARSRSDSAVSLTQKYGVCQKVAIGKGATSVVRLAHKWDRTEEKLYAVKEFRKRRKNETEKEYIKKLTAEFCISSTLHHPNIVETVDLIQDEAQHWCEVMEFCPGGDLYAAIKKGGMSPSEVECCFKQILRGVEYLHSQGVAHRDLKPENLFFDTRGNLKIGDYGASTVYRLPWEATIHMSTGLCGSEPYIAPEQFLGKPYDARLVDVWACGIVYYCLHFQELPWRAAQPATDPLYQAYAAACANPSVAVSSCPSTINNLSPRACRSLVRKMLEPDPGLRSTIEEVMAHSWVKGIEVCVGSEKPTHVHVSARAMGAAQFGNSHPERN